MQTTKTIWGKYTHTPPHTHIHLKTKQENAIFNDNENYTSKNIYESIL